MAIAIGAAVAVGTSVVSSQINGATSGGSSGGGQGGGSGLSFQQTQMANSIKYNEGPKFGGSKEPGISNPDMPLSSAAPRAEKAASNWNINSTPAQGEGDQQAKHDANSMWADRLSRYLDYNSRGLG